MLPKLNRPPKNKAKYVAAHFYQPNRPKWEKNGPLFFSIPDTLHKFNTLWLVNETPLNLWLGLANSRVSLLSLGCGKTSIMSIIC